MAGNTPLDIAKVWNITRHVFTQFSFPSVSILIDAFMVPRCKGVGVDSPVLCLRSEDYRCPCCIHLYFFKQEKQIKQVATLKALDHAA
jgi:hypothetical protein